MKIKTLLEDIVNELGDLKNIKPYEVVPKKLGKEESYRFITEEGDVGFIHFSHLDDEEVDDMSLEEKYYGNGYEVEYSLNGTYLQSHVESLGELLRIISTVVEAIKIHMEKSNSLLYVVYGARKRNLGGTNQKFNLYKAVVSKHIPPGWEIGETNKSLYGPGFYIKKK